MFSLEGRRLLLKLGIFVFNTLVFSVKYLGLSPDPNLQLALSKKTGSNLGFIESESTTLLSSFLFTRQECFCLSFAYVARLKFFIS
jgi:hypothetical protein